MKAKKVTIGVVNYNGINVLPETLHAVNNLTYPYFDIMIVDNGSTDGSREWVEARYPQVCICALGENVGLPGARNIIIQEAKSDYLFIMDNDISVEPNMLTQLMDVMEKVDGVGVCHPEICDENDPSVYHYNGGHIHYLCSLISRKKPLPYAERPLYEQFDVISGAAMLMRRQTALEIGGFDADYFFNWEDGDFTARMTLAGYKCLNIPHAFVHHRSKPRGTSKAFYQVRNRWYFILKLFSWRTILLITPMLVLFELTQAGLLLLKGAGKEYLRGTVAVFKDMPMILKKRNDFQKLKIVKDEKWLHRGEMFVPSHLMDRKIMDILNKIVCNCFNFYWHCATVLL
ncbi:MAG: glycosyltransferase family 2 protein [Chloroflexi bacterium]|nr:MAG: glycosyltransferase family 2 protein [Chloroflexota bacterium]